jgi:hypothetical protein
MMARFITLCWLAIFAAACSDATPEPWSAAEMHALSEQFSHIAEAYAVVDICIPMIDADKEAKLLNDAEPNRGTWDTRDFEVEEHDVK